MSTAKKMEKEQKINHLTIIIEKDKDGYYTAEVSELPGCFTQAKTLNELFKRLQEAIELYIETTMIEITA